MREGELESGVCKEFKVVYLNGYKLVLNIQDKHAWREEKEVEFLIFICLQIFYITIYFMCIGTLPALCLCSMCVINAHGG